MQSRKVFKALRLFYFLENNFCKFILYFLSMTENEISTIVVDTCYKMHVKLGPGLLESVYEAILYYELTKKGLFVERQKTLPVVWDEIKLDIGFRTDLIIENKLILEIKSIEKITEVHAKQIMTYLKITKMKLGLLINFNVPLIKFGITRIVNNL
jgi:GxxExxY protein